jgi:hypothetical protein
VFLLESTEYTGHRHLFDAQGHLHCVLPDTVEFGATVGLPHPKNLYKVLNGAQTQLLGWRSSITLVV